MEGMYQKTGLKVYEDMTRFFVKIFSLIFGIGVATGIVMEVIRNKWRYNFEPTIKITTVNTRYKMATLFGIEYSTLWFLVEGATFTGYAILDGFDLGAGPIHLLLKKEESRRIALNAIDPVWDGNEVWLVIGVGLLFAGFLKVYTAVFSLFIYHLCCF